MRHVSWIPYTDHADQLLNNDLFASNWYKLFEGQPTDGRNKLTWRDRFHSVVNVMYNFYSPGDQVFAVHTGAIGIGDIGRLWGERSTWALQEKLKGRMDLLGNTLGSVYGGWGFSGFHNPWDSESSTWTMMSPEDAMELSDETLREHPFFDTGIDQIEGIEALYDEATGSDWAFSHHSTLLSEFVPALSLAAGLQLTTETETRHWGIIQKGISDEE